MSFDFRPYAAGDERAIIELSKLNFPTLNLTQEGWRWRYVENPAGPAVIELAWDGRRLVGHYALSLAKLTCGGEPLRAIQSMLTMTHPDYRGRGIFAAIARSAYARAAADGIELLFGFPNRASHSGFLRKLGWHTVYEIPMLRLPLARVPLPKLEGTVEGVRIFPRTVEMLWNSLSPSFPFAIAKTAEYLNWRYTSYRYTKWVHFPSGARNHEPAGIDGVLVAKRYRAECQVVCLLCKDAGVGWDLIRAVAFYYQKVFGVQSVSLWQNPNSRLHCLLEKQGFANGDPVMYFGGLALRPGLAMPMAWQNYANWRLEMGDNDVF